MSEDLDKMDKGIDSLQRGIEEFKQGKVEDCPEKYLAQTAEKEKILATLSKRPVLPGYDRESLWRTIESIDSDNDLNITQVMDVTGGVVLRTTYVIGEHLSQSMVFLPGFEVTPNGKIRKQ